MVSQQLPYFDFFIKWEQLESKEVARTASKAKLFLESFSSNRLSNEDKANKSLLGAFFPRALLLIPLTFRGLGSFKKRNHLIVRSSDGGS